jgi:serine/threonine protein kinase
MIIGETLGSYEISKQIGEGGMGEVYLALHKHMGRMAAIKVLRQKYSSEPEVVERFFTEARSASLVEHPGIVRVYDCAVHTDGRAYIVMEYLEGQTLGSALERVGCIDDMLTIVDLSWQIATALQAAHDKGIVHRDLKPDNIFLTFPPDQGANPQGPKPIVKILDFGIAKLLHSMVKATQTGSLLGTPLYMSPEQGRGSGLIDHRADIYSLGCIMFEMTTGRPPFVREGAGELIIAHASEMPPLASKIQRSTPPEFAQLIASTLAKRPEDRPQTMLEVATRLEMFRGHKSAMAATEPLIPDLPNVDNGRASQNRQAAQPAYERKPQPRRVAPTEILPPEEREPRSPRSIIRAPMVTEHTWLARVHETSFAPSPVREVGRPRLQPSTTLSSSPSSVDSSSSLPRRPYAGIFPYVGGGVLFGGVIVLVVALTNRPKPAREETQAPAAVEVVLPKLAFSPPPPPAPPVPAPAPVAPPAQTAPPSTATPTDSAAHAEPQKAKPRPHHKLAEASRAHKDPAAEAMKSAEDALDQGDYVYAAMFAKLATQHGAGVRAYLILGQCKVHLKSYTEARRAYQTALDLDPDNATALLGLRAIKIRTSESE